jgi:DNA-binding response OmpR family regulator
VLQRIDRHPIGELDGVEVERFGRPALDLLLERRVLVQRPDLAELDGCPVQWLRGRPFVFDLDGEQPPAEIDPRLLITYEIDVMALGRVLHQANGLSGGSVEALSDLAWFIGTHGTGNRRRSVCLVRLMRDGSAVEIVSMVRAQLGSEPLVLLTPYEAEFRRGTLRSLVEDRVLVVSLIDVLDGAPPNPFALRSGTLTRAAASARSSGRLRVDTAGRSATLDDVAISLRRQDFAVFSTLAEEAAHKNGVVSRDDLLRMIEAQRTDPDEVAAPENLDNALSRIRRALAEAAGIPSAEMKSLIETRRGLGHRLGLEKLGLEPTDIAIV